MVGWEHNIYSGRSNADVYTALTQDDRGVTWESKVKYARLLSCFTMRYRTLRATDCIGLCASILILWRDHTIGPKHKRLLYDIETGLQIRTKLP